MTELIAGISLGLGSGVAPGPLLTLVVTSTLERGFGAGARVAAAPLITDAPIVGLSVALAGSLSPRGLQALGVIGGTVVIGLGLRIATATPHPDGTVGGGRADVWRGVIVNVLSPHPWIFWLTAGGPLLVASWRRGPAGGILLLVGFYALLVGTKVAIAAVVARTADRLSSQTRRRLVILGGVLLVFGGAILLAQSVRGRL